MIWRNNKTSRLVMLSQIKSDEGKKIWLEIDVKTGVKTEIEQLEFKYYTPLEKTNNELK